MNLTETRLRNSIDSIPAMGWCSFTEVAFKLPNDIHSSLRRTDMAKLGRLTPNRFLVFGFLILASTSWAQTRSPIAEQIAKAYGLDSYEQVEAIRYTFNIRGAISVSRSWVWEPKTGQISYEEVDKDGKPVKVTFVQSKLTADSPIVKDKIDWLFVNDNYWAFLPFHVTGIPQAPMHKTWARKNCRWGRVRRSS